MLCGIVDYQRYTTGHSLLPEVVDHFNFEGGLIFVISYFLISSPTILILFLLLSRLVSEASLPSREEGG